MLHWSSTSFGDQFDSKLVELARRGDRPILTNDLNLNRIADLQGVRVLNVNSLANAVKPALLPGEDLRVRVIQPGKDAGQVKPKPSPATSWAECICEVRSVNARSSMVPFRSPSSTTRLLGSAAMAWPSACTPMSREAVQKPALGFTRTDPGWAT